MGQITKTLAYLFSIVSAVIIVYLWNLDYFQKQESVKVHGVIDEICSPVEELYKVNELINPILNDLKHTKFFRIFKVNLENDGPFWDAQGTCLARKCSVGEGDSGEVPDEWRQCDKTYDVERDLVTNEMSMIDKFYPYKHATEWMKIEEDDQNAIFVNIDKNSESMTYFNGSHIWSAIYKENGLSIKSAQQCKEDKILYRLISGIHANIDMHISQYNYDHQGNPLDPNYARFFEKVGSHKEYVDNMHFTFSFVLNAINKLADKVGGFEFLKEDPAVNQLIKQKMEELVESSLKTCQEPFKESNMLSDLTSQEFLTSLKPVFYNITRILDGVTCEKCRLHGKLQFTGMTAVMKIMFGDSIESKLTRNEMVGLINLMAKLSNSLRWYQYWLSYEEVFHNQKLTLLYSTGLTLALVSILLIKNFGLESQKVVNSPKESDDKKLKQD